MSFKIGFTAQKEDIARTENQTINNEALTPAKKSVVEVYFPDRGFACSYYNDMFDLKRGDIVYVEGKLEGLRGRVVEINHTFKIKLSDYKRIIGVADTAVVGQFHTAGSHLITIDPNALNFSRIITWFKAPEPEEEEFVSSTDDESFNLNDLSGMKIDKATADKGHEYYIDNRVQYIELSNGKGRVIVEGSKPYEVEFNYKNGQISGLVCNCYCTGACKHEFATMLQLKDILTLIEKEYPDFNPATYLSAVSKNIFYDFVLQGHKKRVVTIA